MGNDDGFTMLELLLVIAIIGVLVGIGVFSARRVLAGQQESAAVNTIRQTVWQGATAAAARGQEAKLVLEDGQLELRVGAAVIRTEELPGGVSTNLPAELVFTPPGKLAEDSLEALRAAQPLWIQTSERQYRLEVSVIGEVIAEAQP